MLSPYHDPNYNPYPQHSLIGTAVLFMIIVIAAISLRFYSRLATPARLGVDDWIAFLSMDNLYWALDNPNHRYGGLSTRQQLIGGHVAHTDQLIIFEKTRYAYQLLGVTGLWVIKLSVLFFYRRFFSCRSSRLVSDTLIGITVLWGTAFTMVCAFQCTPVATLWTNIETEYSGFCIKAQPFYLSMAVSDLVLDCVIFLVPIPHLYRLQLPLRQKLAAGDNPEDSVIAIGITRIVIFQWITSFSASEPSTYFSDITWYAAGTLFWQLAENVVGLLGCCLPTYAPLFRSRLGRRKTNDESFYSTHSNFRISVGYNKSPLHRQRLEYDEISLRPAAGGASSVNFEHEILENYALESIPKGKIMVNREFRTETSFM
ncbi:uncharacterized protein GGS22DRAFT_183150 [Annulohypoxylon maeteangense]|uniref:uncharacterized protein n=1 Tax=Annulohypoxylon maeteangense TaxID=1927788 RepID=UPI0020084C40|nr:uncharacterized protein GGS22DRAFT_183150 [Annulohypoxylon maeteangense]KAI0889807.1 hypothetical protein GGS22DRAFT_183150 [Annulohypoxylon maeteangense]